MCKLGESLDDCWNTETDKRHTYNFNADKEFATS